MFFFPENSKDIWKLSKIVGNWIFLNAVLYQKMFRENLKIILYQNNLTYRNTYFLYIIFKSLTFENIVRIFKMFSFHFEIMNNLNVICNQITKSKAFYWTGCKKMQKIFQIYKISSELTMSALQLSAIPKVPCYLRESSWEVYLS